MGLTSFQTAVLIAVVIYIAFLCVRSHANRGRMMKDHYVPEGGHRQMRPPDDYYHEVSNPGRMVAGLMMPDPAVSPRDSWCWCQCPAGNVNAEGRISSTDRVCRCPCV